MAKFNFKKKKRSSITSATEKRRKKHRKLKAQKKLGKVLDQTLKKPSPIISNSSLSKSIEIISSLAKPHPSVSSEPAVSVINLDIQEILQIDQPGQTRSGLSHALCPGNKFSSISFQRGLQVNVMNRSGFPYWQTIAIASWYNSNICLGPP